MKSWNRYTQKKVWVIHIIIERLPNPNKTFLIYLWIGNSKKHQIKANAYRPSANVILNKHFVTNNPIINKT